MDINLANFITIQAGLITALVALMIYMANGRQDREDDFKVNTKIKLTYIFPAILVEILILMVVFLCFGLIDQTLKIILFLLAVLIFFIPIFQALRYEHDSSNFDERLWDYIVDNFHHNFDALDKYGKNNNEKNENIKKVIEEIFDDSIKVSILPHFSYFYETFGGVFLKTNKNGILESFDGTKLKTFLEKHKKNIENIYLFTEFGSKLKKEETLMQLVFENESENPSNKKEVILDTEIFQTRGGSENEISKVEKELEKFYDLGLCYIRKDQDENFQNLMIMYREKFYKSYKKLEEKLNSKTISHIIYQHVFNLNLKTIHADREQMFLESYAVFKDFLEKALINDDEILFDIVGSWPIQVYYAYFKSPKKLRSEICIKHRLHHNFFNAILNAQYERSAENDKGQLGAEKSSLNCKVLRKTVKEYLRLCLEAIKHNQIGDFEMFKREFERQSEFDLEGSVNEKLNEYAKFEDFVGDIITAVSKKGSNDIVADHDDGTGQIKLTHLILRNSDFVDVSKKTIEALEKTYPQKK